MHPAALARLVDRLVEVMKRSRRKYDKIVRELPRGKLRYLGKTWINNTVFHVFEGRDYYHVYYATLFFRDTRPAAYYYKKIPKNKIQ